MKQLSSITILFLLHLHLSFQTGAASAGNLPAGVTIEQWRNIQSQMNLNHYKAQPDDLGAYQSLNLNHGWQINYDTDGTTTLRPLRSIADSTNDSNNLHTMANEGYHIALKLQSIAYQGDDSVNLSTPDALSVTGERLNYHWNENITEYWINSEAKLEQWFEIKQRLTTNNNHNTPLQLEMRLDTNLKVTLNENSLKIGEITYDRLKVWDANGQIIAANMTYDNNKLSLLVDDKNATYPLTIDPSFAQHGMFKMSGGGLGQYENFGSSVAIAGDTMVVGVPNQHENLNPYETISVPAPGKVHVFVLDDSSGTWELEATLLASNHDEDDNDQFGYSVDISESFAGAFTVVVGAPRESSDATTVDGDETNNASSGSGAAYVFVRVGTTWFQQAYLKASNTDSGDRFGSSVAISEHTILVGAPSEDSNATHIGGIESDNSSIDSGAVYAFVRSGITWTQQAYIKATNTFSLNLFGGAVDISGNTAIIGSVGELSGATGVNGNQNDTSASFSGAAYIYGRNSVNNIWSSQAYLKASNTDANDEFGTSVAISGTTIVIGAPFEDSATHATNGQAHNARTDIGAAYVFEFDTALGWVQSAFLKAGLNIPGLGQEENFGASVAIDNDTIIVGLPGDILDHIYDTEFEYPEDSKLGAAYMFIRDSTLGEWSYEEFLKPTNTRNGDEFGTSVAVSGDTVIVGAPFQDSNLDGFIRDPLADLDFSSEDSGAAYVYRFAHTISATIIGLEPGNNIRLWNNDTDNIFVIHSQISQDGVVTFSDALFTGETYDVTVVSPGYNCSVDNGTGTVADFDITDVVVNCAITPYFVGGVLTGLESNSSVILQNHSGKLATGYSTEMLTLNDNGNFIFSDLLVYLDDYTVTISSQPTGSTQTCSVSGASVGVMALDHVRNISVHCATDTYTVGGAVTGLSTGSSLTLQNNLGDDLIINTNGDFTFATALANGAAYDVVLAAQPTSANEVCVVSNPSGSGEFNIDITDILVTCTTTTEPEYTIGGMVVGLTDGNVIGLINNSDLTDLVTVTHDGSFTFTHTHVGGAGYDVTIYDVVTSDDQVCVVTDGSGHVIISTGDVTTVLVTCESTFSTPQYTIGGTVTGLESGSIVTISQDNTATVGFELYDNGTFIYPDTFEDGEGYEWFVIGEPSSEDESCVINNNAGTINGANIADLAVVCTTVSGDLIFKNSFEE